MAPDPSPDTDHQPDEDDSPFPRWRRRLAEADELLAAVSAADERPADAEPER